MNSKETLNSRAQAFNACAIATLAEDKVQTDLEFQTFVIESTEENRLHTASVVLCGTLKTHPQHKFLHVFMMEQTPIKITCNTVGVERTILRTTPEALDGVYINAIEHVTGIRTLNSYTLDELTSPKWEEMKKQFCEVTLTGITTIPENTPFTDPATNFILQHAQMLIRTTSRSL